MLPLSPPLSTDFLRMSRLALPQVGETPAPLSTELAEMGDLGPSGDCTEEEPVPGRRGMEGPQRGGRRRPRLCPRKRVARLVGDLIRDTGTDNGKQEADGRPSLLGGAVTGRWLNWKHAWAWQGREMPAPQF